MTNQDFNKKKSSHERLVKTSFMMALILFMPFGFIVEDAFAQTRVTGNPFADFWSGVFNPSQPRVEEGAIIITPNYVPLFSAIIILIVMVIGGRYIVNARRHPNSEQPIGTVQFVIMDQGIVEMFVSKYDAPLRPSIIRALKSNDKFKKAIDEIIRLRDNDQIYFYQAYYKKTKDLLTSTMKRRRIPAMLITTAPLDEPEIAFTQTEQKFSFGSLGWEYMKTTVCHNSTEKFQVELENGWMDVWLMAPIPNAKLHSTYEKKHEQEETEIEFNVWKEMHLESIVMNVNILPYSDELAKVASSMVQASKQVQYIEGLDQHIQTQQGELQERDRIINKLRQKINTLKLLLGQKKLIGTDLPAGFYRPKDMVQWIAVSIFGIIFMGYLPEIIPSMSSIPPQFLEAIGGVGAMAIYMMSKKSRSKQEEDLLQEEGIDKNNLNL